VDSVTPLAPTAQAVGEAIEERLSQQLAVVLTTARRRAARCGDRELDTAHLLHSLLESDPVVRAFLGGGGPQTAKLLAYLAQRCIGYGLRWRDTVEECGRPRGPGDGSGALPGWSPAAARALDVALERTKARGAACAEGVDLFAGLAADAECRAVEVLRTAGVDAGGLAAGLNVRGHWGDTPVSS
jgi:Clp amino terminal domain, pathogenicity island component